MTANVLDIINQNYPNALRYYGDQEDAFVGGIYLIGRDYDDPRVVVAKQIHETNKRYIVHEGRAYRAGMVNHPKTKVGDWVGVLEVVDAATFRRDRRYQVTEMLDDGVRVSSGTRNFVAKFWVLHSDNVDVTVPDRTDPNRRQYVIERLTTEGMSRIGDTGYATSAREFFDKFDLPHPDVAATAMVDIEKKLTWGDMGYETRDMFARHGISTNRTITLNGRAKIALDKGPCRCKDMTIEEVKAAAARKGVTITDGTLHKVQCMWCVPVSDMDEFV